MAAILSPRLGGHRIPKASQTHSSDRFPVAVRLKRRYCGVQIAQGGRGRGREEAFQASQKNHHILRLLLSVTPLLLCHENSASVSGWAPFFLFSVFLFLISGFSSILLTVCCVYRGLFCARASFFLLTGAGEGDTSLAKDRRSLHGK